uniref:Uncharacterized protein n=1 Tax=Anguilla anguilla TaxID=7936 RepID=A0A0E9QRN4_ANGAN
MGASRLICGFVDFIRRLIRFPEPDANLSGIFPSAESALSSGRTSLRETK